MKKLNFGDLEAFVAIAKAGSFRKAAIDRGVSGPAMSQALRNLEEQLGVRLLNRTTRSIALTEAGEQLLGKLSIAFETIGSAVEATKTQHGNVTGRLRINAPAPAVEFVLAPVVPEFLAAYPGVSVELISDANRVDMVGEGFDAGVRFGRDIDADMIAVPIGGALRYIVAGSPDYLSRRGVPGHPKELVEHDCIRFRFPSGNIFDWSFRKGEEEYTLTPDGPYTVNDAHHAVRAACAGVGLSWTLIDFARPDIEAGRLVQLLDDWTPYINPWSLYYPSKRHMPAALRAFIDFLKARKI
ncbi:LysR family transcriptional regulator [Thalassospira australica]|uniref:LysR family transcriptional regulator n=1 Tax=Thalassospira australica TaxID=1528106 RepID=UPI00384AAA53